MKTMEFSLMEIMMAYIGKAHLDEFSDKKKWTILGLINKPGSHLETDIGVKFKMYTNEDLKAILLEKIINLQTQLSQIYPTEKVVRKEIQKHVPDSEMLPSTNEDPKNIIDDALSVHDSSDESEDDQTPEVRNCDDEISANESTQETEKDRIEETPSQVQKRRGRPKKSIDVSTGTPVQGKRTPGRPKKSHGGNIPNEVEQDVEISTDGHVSRKPGRPKGSKNKSLDTMNILGDEHSRRKVTPFQVKNKRGRPRKSHGADSSNRFDRDGTISDDEYVKRKRGRPKGSKNKSVIIYNQ